MAPDDFTPEPTPWGDSHTYIATPFDETIPRTPWLADQFNPLGSKGIVLYFGKGVDPLFQIGGPGCTGNWLNDGECRTGSDSVWAPGNQFALEDARKKRCESRDAPAGQRWVYDDSAGNWLKQFNEVCRLELTEASRQATATAEFSAIIEEQRRRASGSHLGSGNNPTATPNDRGGVHHSDAERRSRALAQCYPGGRGLSDQIVAGESNGINMGAQKAQFRRQFGDPCRCGICVH